MKKGLLSWYALSILMAGTGTAFFSSCSDNDDSTVNPPVIEDNTKGETSQNTNVVANNSNN